MKKLLQQSLAFRKILFFDVSGVLNPRTEAIRKKKANGKLAFADEVHGIVDEEIRTVADSIGVVGFLRHIYDLMSPLNPDLDDFDYQSYCDFVYFSEEFHDVMEVNPRIRSFFEELNTDDLELFIISGFSGNIERVLEIQNIKEFFPDDNIISIDRVNDRNKNPHDIIRKPNPEMYSFAEKVAMINPEEDDVYFIDDSLENLIVGDGFGWICLKSNIDEKFDSTEYGFPVITDLFDLKWIFPELFREESLFKSIPGKEGFYERSKEFRRVLDETNIEKSCPCPKTKCPRRGNCAECVRVHRIHKNHLPYCMAEILNDIAKDLAVLVESTLEKKQVTPPEYYDYLKEMDKKK